MKCVRHIWWCRQHDAMGNKLSSPDKKHRHCIQPWACECNPQLHILLL